MFFNTLPSHRCCWLHPGPALGFSDEKMARWADSTGSALSEAPGAWGSHENPMLINLEDFSLTENNEVRKVFFVGG